MWARAGVRRRNHAPPVRNITPVSCPSRWSTHCCQGGNTPNDERLLLPPPRRPVAEGIGESAVREGGVTADAYRGEGGDTDLAAAPGGAGVCERGVVFFLRPRIESARRA